METRYCLFIFILIARRCWTKIKVLSFLTKQRWYLSVLKSAIISCFYYCLLVWCISWFATFNDFSCLFELFREDSLFGFCSWKVKRKMWECYYLFYSHFCTDARALYAMLFNIVDWSCLLAKRKDFSRNISIGIYAIYFDSSSHSLHLKSHR